MVIVGGARRLVVVFLVSVGGFLLAGGASARGDSVECGGTVTVDTVLTEHLTGCGDLGVEVAEGVTLDLNGHTVSGVGGGTGLWLHQGSTAMHGTVSGFGGGVFVAGGGARITSMSVRANVNFGVLLNAPGHVDRSEISENGSGVGLSAGANGSSVVHSVIFSNGGAGITGFQADLALYENNLIMKNGGPGIALSQSTANIRNNKIRSNGGDGITISDFCPQLGFYGIGGNDIDKNGALGIRITLSLPECVTGDLAEVIAQSDEGGNTAKSNGDPRECVYIVCRKN